MTIAKWKVIAPDCYKIKNLPPQGGVAVFEHTLGTTAPIVGDWLAFLPTKFSGYDITNWDISIPYLDSASVIRWQIGVIDTVTSGGIMRAGDSGTFAGVQNHVTGSGVAQQLLVNGLVANGSGTAFYSAGAFGNDHQINISFSDLMAYAPPFDKLSNGASSGDYSIGLVCTTAPTGWQPTDAAPKKIRCAMTMVPKALRN